MRRVRGAKGFLFVDARFRLPKGRLTYPDSFDGRDEGWSYVSTGWSFGELHVGLVGYEGETYDGDHEGIVDHEIWDEAQKLLRDRDCFLPS